VSNFQPGDIVRLQSGEMPMIVTRVNPEGTKAFVVYLKSSSAEMAMHCWHRRSADRLIPYSSLASVPEKHHDRINIDSIERALGSAIANRVQAWLNDNDQPQPEETAMTKLYQTKEETPRFGTLLATNSAGHLVLEMKGSGAVETFPKSAVEVVHPYTVDIRFPGSSQTYSYLARKGEVEVGDVILVDAERIAKVVKINTKSNRATVNLIGRKLLTMPLGEGSTDDVTED
jgi:uncharacterized protein YodC (DUF2158 family)